MDIIYVYDGTLDGFLSCVFEAFEERETPIRITKHGSVQLALGARARDIPTNPEYSDRVRAGIRQKLGGRVLGMMYNATLSAEKDAETAALAYLRLAFKMGRAVYSDLTDPRVIRMNKIYHTVANEAGRYLEFLRFSELEGGILFGEFEPEPNVLPLIMPHFANRLNARPFIIHDINRRLAGVYDTREWILVSSEDMRLPRFSENEEQYRGMWRLFYNTLAIKERVSERRRMRHLPKKYWNHLTEMVFQTAAE